MKYEKGKSFSVEDIEELGEKTGKDIYMGCRKTGKKSSKHVEMCLQGAVHALNEIKENRDDMINSAVDKLEYLIEQRGEK